MFIKRHCFVESNELFFESRNDIFLGVIKDGAGLRSLEIQLAKCGNVSDLENICTNTIELQQVRRNWVHRCL